MSEKKVVGRNIAIALGLICIVLAVGLVGAVGSYTLVASLNSQITEKDNTISSLNSQLASKDSQISSLDSQVTSLQNQVNSLNDTVNLAKSSVYINNQTISQPANSYTHWIPALSASYAGYVSVWVQTSTTNDTYVRVVYTAYGVNFDQVISVGTGGTAVFPLLPCSSIDIRVGNTNLIDGATETVTITYHY
jgi:uncharacterized coiled-coil protein SlyX